MMEAGSQIRLLKKLKSALGPKLLDALNDPQIIEIVLNPDGALFIERLGSGFEQYGELSAERAEVIIGTIAHVLDVEAGRDSPVVSGTLLINGHRFEGLLPPIVTSPAFAIRRRASQIVGLDAFAVGESSEDFPTVIRKAVELRKNIVICGGTGSGKTTLANAVIAEIASQFPADRLVILEDTDELAHISHNATKLLTRPNADMDRLLKSTLRLRPDRIIVGELRDGAALTLLKAWNTGHPGGVTTIHANNARQALSRLEQLVGERSVRVQEHFIADAVDLVVFVERTPSGRAIRQIVQVNGYRSSGYDISDVPPTSGKAG